MSKYAQRGVTVSFVERYVSSEPFEALFKEGMSLVERTAAYLDGEGRLEARRLKAPATLAYASESMRLTTRLLELASWLLIRRSLNAGEITHEEARDKRRKVKLKTVARPAHIKGYETLPEALRLLIEASYALQDRIVHMDRMIEAAGMSAVQATPATNPLAPHMARIQAAFGAAANAAAAAE